MKSVGSQRTYGECVVLLLERIDAVEKGGEGCSAEGGFFFTWHDCWLSESVERITSAEKPGS